MNTNKSTQTNLCPNCGTKGKKIIYGLPREEDWDKGLHLGGCIVSDSDPKYFCEVCNEGFGY